MSDLYRIDLDTPDVGDSNFDETRDKYLAALTAWGVLVPVTIDRLAVRDTIIECDGMGYDIVTDRIMELFDAVGEEER